MSDTYNMRGGFAIRRVQDVEELIANFSDQDDWDDEGYADDGDDEFDEATASEDGNEEITVEFLSTAFALLEERVAKPLLLRVLDHRAFLETGSSQQPVQLVMEGLDLPSRAQFLGPRNAEGLLALSDRRAFELPSVQAFHNSRTEAYANDCLICNDIMSDLNEVVVIAKCGHIYHRDCLMPWFAIDVRYHACPYCRTNLFDGHRQQDEEQRIDYSPEDILWLLTLIDYEVWGLSVYELVSRLQEGISQYVALQDRIEYAFSREVLSEEEESQFAADNTQLNELQGKIDDAEFRVRLMQEEAQRQAQQSN